MLLKKLFSRKIKIVNTPHGPFMALKEYKAYEKTFKFLIESFERLSNKAYDLVIQVNPYQSEWLPKYGIKKEKIVYVPNGIPEDIFSAKANKKVLKKFNLEKYFLISYIGRIQKYKGLDQVIKVIPEIIKENKNVKFVIIGEDAGYKNYLLNLIEELKVKSSVIFTGKLKEKNDVLSILNHSEIFVFPSEWEAFGIVILEAMAKKNAIISTNTEGGKFLVKNNINGFLYNFNDLNELKKCLKKLIKDSKLRRKMQSNNLEKAKKFTWNKIAKDLEKEYLRIR